MQRLSSLFFILFTCAVFAQNEYRIDLQWDNEENPMQISQVITWTNNSTKPQSSVFLLDWNHAYSSEKSPLGLFLANEFDYKIIRASKQQRGGTQLKSIIHADQNLSWNRLTNQLDVIEISFPEAILPKASISFFIEYSINLPDARIFNYGKGKKHIHAQQWHLVLASLNDNGSWNLDSNLGVDAPKTPRTETTYTISLPNTFKLVSPAEKTKFAAPLIAEKNKKFIHVPFGSGTLITDMFSAEKLTPDFEIVLDEMAEFVSRYFSSKTDPLILASKKDYAQRPILGLETLPAFVNAFTEIQYMELPLLKIILDNCIDSYYQNQKDSNSWILEGLSIYIWNQYVNTKYPNLKMTGTLSQWPIIKNYNFTQAPFYRLWELAANISANNNRGQKLSEPNNKLTRYNRKVANPSRAGLALLYLDAYLEAGVLNQVIKNLPNNSRLDLELKEKISERSDKPIDWFFEHYIKQSNNSDLIVTGKKIDENIHQINVKSSFLNTAIPISQTDYKGNVESKWISANQLPYTIKLNSEKIKAVTINQNHFIPEQSLSNNTYRLDRQLFRNNLRLRLFQDIAKSGTAILLVTPEFSYNFYDGFMAGISLGNSSILGNTFNFKLNPQYGTKSGKMNGSATLIANVFHENKSHYLTRFTLSGYSYHFAPKKRYTSFTPSIQFFYRPNGILDKHRSRLLLRHVAVGLKSIEEQERIRSYNISIALYEARIGDALKNLTYKTELQHAKNFAKTSIEAQYIAYYLPNRRWTMRLFAGGFLMNKLNSDTYFDINASRVNDYLFQYDLYGRSESEGLFSQQYIKAEGGLRTTGSVASANQWLVTAQASTTIWRWFEGYAEVGYIKNKGVNSTTHWGTGVTLNLVPDFFEIHFPMYDTTGNLLKNNAYPSQIRFQLSLSPSALFRLFSRSWF